MKFLSKFYQKQRERYKDVDPNDIDINNKKLKEHFFDPTYTGYEFDEVYYHSLNPQMIDKIEDYKEGNILLVNFISFET